MIERVGGELYTRAVLLLSGRVRAVCSGVRAVCSGGCLVCGRGCLAVASWVLLGCFRLWQLLVSPTYGQTCRFYPSCSAYGVQAVQEHGAVRGGWLTMRRVLRCHPWNPGGFDPVPPTGRTALAADHDESVPPMRCVA